MSSEFWLELLRDHKLLFMCLGTIVAVVGIVASQSRRAYVAKVEAELKRDLASRGRSAEEIERILSAKSEATVTWEAGVITGQDPLRRKTV